MYISILNSNFAHRSFCINSSRLKESAMAEVFASQTSCLSEATTPLSNYPSPHCICPTLFQHSPSQAVLLPPTLAKRRGVNTKPFGTSELNSKFTRRQCSNRQRQYGSNLAFSLATFVIHGSRVSQKLLENECRSILKGGKIYGTCDLLEIHDSVEMHGSFVLKAEKLEPLCKLLMIIAPVEYGDVIIDCLCRTPSLPKNSEGFFVTRNLFRPRYSQTYN